MLILSVTSVYRVKAQADDPAAFVVASGSTHSGGSGWCAGYVVNGQSGTFTLNIAVTGSQKQFPITGVKVIVAISDAAEAGGLASLSIDGTPITTWTPGAPPYYPPGGPFQESDYYGYNDEYIIPQLTFSEAHYPDNWYQLTVTINFAPTATQSSKVMFLCYGTDNDGNPVKTPFSEGTMFVIPEYIGPIIALCSCFAAYGAYKKIKH
jgi:hypothetical protein